MAREANLFQILRAIPPKWAFGIVFALLVYWLTQPMINRTLGTSLPSLRSIVTGEADPAPKPDSKSGSKKSTETVSAAAPASKETASKNTAAKNANGKPLTDKKSSGTDESLEPVEAAKPAKATKPTGAVKSATKTAPEKDKASAKSNAPKLDPDDRVAESPSTTKTQSDSKSPSVTKSTSDKSSSASLEYNYLEEVGRNRFQSPAGLMYVPGSEEGHRLKHLQRHLEDQPNRPGSHGVFDGDMEQVLHWIDEAYSAAKKGGRGTKKYDDEDSTVFEASLDKTVGFIGGSDGRRKGNPPTKRIRIVVKGSNVITAFPF